IAALKPRPAFLPILRMLSGIVEYDEARGLLLAERWQDRNRRVSASLSPIFSLFLAPTGILYQKAQHLLTEDKLFQRSNSPLLKQLRPGPKHPNYGIPASQWSTILQHVVEQKKPLRTVAAEYGVSHETIRRIILYIQKQRGQQET